MDREVVYPLLALLNDRVAVYLPSEFLGDAIDFFQSLIDWHCSDRDRGIPEDPFPRLMDIRARRKIHHSVCTPESSPAKLLYLFLNRRCDGRISDIGVDLNLEVPANNHRFDFRMINVCWDDCTAPGYLIPYKLRLDTFSYRHEFHFGSDFAPARVGHLGHRRTPTECSSTQPDWHFNIRGGHTNPGCLNNLTLSNPFFSERRKAISNINFSRPTCIINLQW